MLGRRRVEYNVSSYFTRSQSMGTWETPFDMAEALFYVHQRVIFVQGISRVGSLLAGRVGPGHGDPTRTESWHLETF